MVASDGMNDSCKAGREGRSDSHSGCSILFLFRIHASACEPWWPKVPGQAQNGSNGGRYTHPPCHIPLNQLRMVESELSFAVTIDRNPKSFYGLTLSRTSKNLDDVTCGPCAHDWDSSAKACVPLSSRYRNAFQNGMVIRAEVLSARAANINSSGLAIVTSPLPARFDGPCRISLRSRTD